MAARPEPKFARVAPREDSRRYIPCVCVVVTFTLSVYPPLPIVYSFVRRS